MSKSGAVIGAIRIPSGSDIQAIEHARSMVDGNVVELWEGLRFIETFRPVD